jgi:alpha-tubulin suppressor-like RCC1 family protein
VTFGSTALGSGRNTTAGGGALSSVDFVTDVFNEQIVSTAVGQDNTYFVTNSGKLFGTGNSAYGALSLNTTVSSNILVPIPIVDYNNVTGNAAVKMVSAGLDCAIFITTDGKAYSFGSMFRYATFKSF